jgi:hypothetical protein
VRELFKCSATKVLFARHEKSLQVKRRGGGTSGYTPSQKHQSTYLHNIETKLGLNDPTSSVSVPPSVSVSLLYLSVTSYMHWHTQHVGDLKWVCICGTGIVFSNSIVRMRIVTLPSRLSTSGDFSWRDHYSYFAIYCRGHLHLYAEVTCLK